MRTPCAPTRRQKMIWKVSVSSSTGRLVAVSPTAHPRPNTIARVNAAVQFFLVDCNIGLFLSLLDLLNVLLVCLHMETMMAINMIQLKM